MHHRISSWLIGICVCFGFLVFGVSLVHAQDDPPPVYKVLLPAVQGIRQPRIVIAAAHIDSALSGEPDEAILLWNLDGQPYTLAGWRLRGNGRTAVAPPDSALTIPAHGSLWCAKEATAFAATFGFPPACEWTESDPNVPNLVDGVPALTNSGGVIQLVAPNGEVIDTLLYGNTSTTAVGWEGAAAQLYTRGVIPAQGQVWRRKVDPSTTLPVDSDRSADWAGDLNDLAWGRQVFFPGWRIWREPVSNDVQSSWANTNVAVGPDGLYAHVAAVLGAATERLDLAIYTFEHPPLAQLLVERAQQGVRVRLLVDGSPAGGVSDLQHWCLAQMAAAGVEILWMDERDDAPAGYRPRYRFLHAKYAIVDGRTALVGSENFTLDAMPLTQGNLSPQGRRGFYLSTDAPPVVAEFERIFAADWQPGWAYDLRPFDAAVDGPPPDFVPETPPVEVWIQSPFSVSVAAQGEMRFAVLTAPDNATRPDAALSAILARAGAGDEIHWVQLYEHRFWGDSTSNAVADPNPRLKALIDAARRGASVRLLLDDFFDDSSGLRSNAATAEYVRALAAAEGIDIQARTGNPTGLGIHAKISLLHVDGEHWSIVGSLNGGEISNKLNREVSVAVENAEIYARIRQVFEADWASATR